jgi:hypothetical protein
MQSVAGFWFKEYEAVLTVMFAIGSLLFWYKLAGLLPRGRTSRLALMLERRRLRVMERSQDGSREFYLPQQDSNLTDRERVFLEKARLAGLPPSWNANRLDKVRTAAAGVCLFTGFALLMPNAELLQSLTAGSWISLACRLTGAALFGWWMPVLLVAAAASHKRSLYLLEIAKFAHRLSVCVSDNADIRDMLVRAGRPLKLLKPHLQELTVHWGKDQRTAIWRFKEAVGISEVFPLVNALEAISQADAKEVVKVLKEHTASIEATLASDIHRKIENAPVWISFLIMVPFSMIVVLFLYPWIVSVSKQLMSSFQG